MIGTFLILVFFFVAPAIALAHGGGLDASGCHNNRKTGDYHCHRTAAVAQPPQPANKFTPQRRDEPVCHVGPRGGTYTVTPSGRKNYNGC